jgi:uncharacterized membrane protein YqjE
MADTSTLENFVLFLAGIGGISFLLIVIGISAYSILYLRLPWYNVTFGALWIGLFISLSLTSVDLAESNKSVKRSLIISQTVINCILIVLLGLTAYNYIRNDPGDRIYYIMTVIPVALLLSVVGLSSTMMQKLSTVTPPS